MKIIIWIFACCSKKYKKKIEDHKLLLKMCLTITLIVDIVILKMSIGVTKYYYDLWVMTYLLQKAIIIYFIENNS